MRARMANDAITPRRAARRGVTDLVLAISSKSHRRGGYPPLSPMPKPEIVSAGTAYASTAAGARAAEAPSERANARESS